MFFNTLFSPRSKPPETFLELQTSLDYLVARMPLCGYCVLVYRYQATSTTENVYSFTTRSKSGYNRSCQDHITHRTIRVVTQHHHEDSVRVNGMLYFRLLEYLAPCSRI